MRTATNHKTGKPFIFCYSLLTYSFGGLPFLVNGSCNEVMPLSVALFCKTVYFFWGKSKPPSNPFSHKVCAINSRFLSHTVAYICISQTKNLLRHFSSYHRRVFFIVRFFPEPSYFGNDTCRHLPKIIRSFYLTSVSLSLYSFRFNMIQCHIKR